MKYPRSFRARPPIGFRALLVTVIGALSLGACVDEPTATQSTALKPKASLPATPLPDLTSADLPVFASANTVTSAFSIVQLGFAGAGYFSVANPQAGSPAMEARSDGQGTAAYIIASSSSNPAPALTVRGWGVGTAETATAAEISAHNVKATAPALNVYTAGIGVVARFNHIGTSGDLAVFQVDGVNQIRFDRSGQGFFNGGTKQKGADIAELFAVEGSASRYEPGDVLVISTRTDRAVEKSEGAYSTLVAGVYATKPGVLLTEADIDQTSENEVPLGVVGVIPTKVSAENGAIRRGDLLVTARKPGHAMRGTDRSRMLGATIGKALEEFKGQGTGVIRVLVNVK